MMEEGRKFSEEEFVVQAIKKLRKEPFRGIHSVYSGFNEAFRKYFGTNPVEATTRLAAEGKIEIRPFKGGAMLFLPGEAPKRPSAEEIIQLILESGNRSLSEEEFVIEGIKKLRENLTKGSTVSSAGSMKPSGDISTKIRLNSPARWYRKGRSKSFR